MGFNNRTNKVMLSMRSVLVLVGKNGLAFLLSLLTASLFFPIIFLMLVPDSTYGWWFVLILSGLGMAHVLWPTLLCIVVFNTLVLKVPSRFDSKSSYVGLGTGVGIVLFLCQSVFIHAGEWILLMQNLLLLAGVGALFGFYYYTFTRKN